MIDVPEKARTLALTSVFESPRNGLQRFSSSWESDDASEVEFNVSVSLYDHDVEPLPR